MISIRFFKSMFFSFGYVSSSYTSSYKFTSTINKDWLIRREYKLKTIFYALKEPQEVSVQSKGTYIIRV